MIPYFNPLAGDQLSATTWRLGAISAVKHLRTELHAHRIYPEIAYDEGRPRLVISSELTVWADQAGMIFCWGACFLQGPVDQAPTDDVPQVARRIAGRLGKHYAEPIDPP